MFERAGLSPLRPASLKDALQPAFAGLSLKSSLPVGCGECGGEKEERTDVAGAAGVGKQTLAADEPGPIADEMQPPSVAKAADVPVVMIGQDAFLDQNAFYKAVKARVLKLGDTTTTSGFEGSEVVEGVEFTYSMEGGVPRIVASFDDGDLDVVPLVAVSWKEFVAR